MVPMKIPHPYTNVYHKLSNLFQFCSKPDLNVLKISHKEIHYHNVKEYVTLFLDKS